MTVWANGHLVRSSNSSSSPGTCWGPSSSFPSGHLHNLPAPARLPCSVSSQEGTDFSVLLSYRAEVGTSYFLNALQSFSVLSVTQFSQHPRQNSPKMIFWVNCGMFMDSLILTLAFLKTVFFSIEFTVDKLWKISWYLVGIYYIWKLGLHLWRNVHIDT